MHIMLTRPIEDSKVLISKLKSLGHDVSHMPVIKVKRRELINLKYEEYSGIIFTSSNSIKFLETKNISKSIYCFCVGSATEKLALEKGFQNVYAAGGNVRNLKEIIIQNFSKKIGKLLYVSGEIVSSNLHKELKDENFDIDRVINYEIEHNNDLDQNFIEQMKSFMPEIIYVYSENSAKSLLNIIKKYELVDYWMNTNLMCLGEKTSSVLNEIKWKKIFLFNPGDEEFLLYKI